MLLLRRAVAALRASDHDVTLLAPSPAGPALVGPGAGEAREAVAWDAPDVATLLAAESEPKGPLAERLSGFDLAVAYTRNATLLAKLRALIPRVVACDPYPRRAMHASRWYGTAVEVLGCDAKPQAPLLVATPAEAAAAARFAADLPERFLAIHPGSGAPRKNWPPERFGTLARELSNGQPWLLVDGPADRQAVGAILFAGPKAVVARDLRARVLGALLARAGLYVGNDSGVSHLAAAFGAPTLALFGPSDPAIWSPLGPRVETLRGADAAIETLAITEVLAAARSLAGERPSG